MLVTCFFLVKGCYKWYLQTYCFWTRRYLYGLYMKRVWKWFELINSFICQWLLSLICLLSRPLLDIDPEVGRISRLGMGSGVVVCMCVHFSLLNLKPNIIDFLELLPTPFLSFCTNNRELQASCFLIQQLVFTVLQIKSSRPKRLHSAYLYPKTEWQATLSTSLGPSEWWLLCIPCADIHMLLSLSTFLSSLPA